MTDIRTCVAHGTYRDDTCPTCGIDGTLILSNNYIRSISKHMSWALRHNPNEAGITVDEHGWADVSAVAESANESVATTVTEQKLYGIAVTDEKGRYEINNGRIRAANGHSIDVDVTHESDTGTIPETLYHGTPSTNVAAIEREGLCAMNRNNVHLSEQLTDALEVGKRKSDHVTVFAIDTGELQDAGYTIAEAGTGVYTVEHVPAEYLTIEHE